MTDEERKVILERTNADVVKIIKRDCIRCKYYAPSFSGSFDSKRRYGVCDYIGYTGHIRPCMPGECREKGIFVPLPEGGNRKCKMTRLVLNPKSDDV